MHAHPESSYVHRLGDDIKRRAVVAPGSPDGLFRLLYVLGRESLAEIRNATVHAFLASVLVEAPVGYRLYIAVYVRPVSSFTSCYMAAIEPFRRFIVYPAMMRTIRQRWEERYARFEPSRRLYSSFGFRARAPFGQYVEDPNSVYVTKDID